jgi:hypothetical protein
VLALALLYAASLALATLLLLVFFARLPYATRLTTTLAIAELVVLALHTVLLAVVFLLS